MKMPAYLLFFLLMGGLCLPAYAQKARYIGKIDEVAALYETQAQAQSKATKPAEQVRYRMPGYDLMLRLKSSKKEGNAELFYGDVNEAKGSSFYLKISAQGASGSVLLTEQKKYYRFSSTAEGLVYLTEEDINNVLCVGLPNVVAPAAPPQAANRAAAVPNLESLPGAGAVLYLDFDGQTVSGTLWNNQLTGGASIVAAPATLSSPEMTEVWKLMSEDYRPFALNVTTSEAAFNSAPANRRMRVIFTPTNYFRPGTGGVAYVGSFTWGGTAYGETPCWVFNPTGKYAGEAGSHEAGHTTGLRHDGRISPPEAYFQGQVSWAPIMGTGYYKPLVQFSQGEYPSANNQEDDLLKISTQNGFGYRADDHGDNSGTATALVQNAGGNALAAANTGVISTRTDGDVFSLALNGGVAVITVSPDPDYPDLDVVLTLRDAVGTTVASADPSTQSAALNVTLPAGTYYLTVDGGTGSLGASSDYGSLGAYSIAVTQAPPVCTVRAVAQNVSVTLNASGQASVSAAQVDNGSTASCGIASRGLSRTTFGCADLASPVSVTLTVTDNSGNQSTGTATVTVIDATPPTVVTRNVSVTLAGGTATVTAAQVDNGSSDNCTIASRGLSRTTFGCADLASPVSVTLTVTDNSGNQSTGTATVTVIDATPPTVVTRNVSVTLAGGTATVTAAQVDNGSTDNCTIASRGLSRTTFGCADLANSPISVTLTVTDNSGNQSPGTAFVTVVGTIPTPTIAVTPSTSVYTGGISTNLYLGYGPQSATLTASGGVSYVWSLAAGLSDPNIANPVFTATAAGTFLYTVTATSASGCTATKSVTLTVLDVRCGNKNNKVLVCHNGNSICISPDDVNDHLTGHPGDRLGDCPGLSARASAPVASTGSANELAVYPNPAGDHATVSFRPALDGQAQVLVYNALGQRVASLYEGEVTGGQLYAYPLHSQHLATGLYECRLVVNGKAETRRLIIAR